MGERYVILIVILAWISGLRTTGVSIPHPILGLFMVCFFGAFPEAVNSVPSGSQPSQALTSAIVCAILGGSNLSQSAASASSWFYNSVIVGSSSSSEVRFCTLFLLFCLMLSLRLPYSELVLELLLPLQ